MKAIAIMMRPEVKARISNYINYAPANVKAFDTGVIPKEKPHRSAELAGERREGLRAGRRLVGR